MDLALGIAIIHGRKNEGDMARLQLELDMGIQGRCPE